MKTDFGGLPIAFHPTGGEASDSRNFETLLDIGPDLNPRAALGDKGYDFKSNRDAARQRGIGAAGNDSGRRMLKDVVMGAVELAFQFG